MLGKTRLMSLWLCYKENLACLDVISAFTMICVVLVLSWQIHKGKNEKYAKVKMKNCKNT